MSLPSGEIKHRQKLTEWENRIRLLHEKYPRLEENSRLFAQYTLEQGLLMLGRGKLDLSGEELLKKQDALLFEKKQLLKEYNLPENIYEVWWDCGQCRDTGYVGTGIKCSCLVQEEAKNRWFISGLSPEQERQTFQTFSLEWYDEKDRYRHHMERCLAFAEDVIEGQPTENLLIYGHVGTGKTHLCSAIANYVLEAGESVIYLKVSRLLDLIREYKYSLDRDEQNLHNRFIESLYHVKLLVMDDLGTESLTDFAREQLFLLLDERLNNYLPWVISSNLEPNEIGQYYQARISDRIMGTSQVLTFTGESVRVRKKIKLSAK